MILAANGLGTARLLFISRLARFPTALRTGQRPGRPPPDVSSRPAWSTGPFHGPLESYAGPSGAVSILCDEFYETDRARASCAATSCRRRQSGLLPLQPLALGGFVGQPAAVGARSTTPIFAARHGHTSPPTSA